MRTLNRYTPFGVVLDNEEARAVLEQTVPAALTSPLMSQAGAFPLAGFLQLVLPNEADRIDEVVARLSEVEDTAPERAESDPITPDPSYEGSDVRAASAEVTPPVRAEQRRPVEIVLGGPSHGNPFVDVELTAVFSLGDVEVHAGGFYDGDGRYVLRFLPSEAGAWRFRTSSTARSLDGVDGTVEVAAGAARGAVRVTAGHGFAYDDGSPYVPFGTTAYAWTHQEPRLQEQTLDALRDAPFTKLRMGLFPKHFLYNSNEPTRFVFPRSSEGWDTERFDLDYFHDLELRLGQLDEMGVQADLILFHPYDRWGFAELDRAADDRYVRYVVRRLAAFPNVWWSLANEWDLLLTKQLDDWHRLGELVRAEDHAGHPLSIHNWVEVFDYSAPWATHASIQRGDAAMGSRVDEWRRAWGKPVVVDEFGYDGDLDQGWGNLTGHEVVDRFWSGMLRGGYLSHGETFWNEAEEVFWAKGGRLIGESPARIAFLRSVVEASPTGRLEPLVGEWDALWGGVDGEYVLVYYGTHRPRFRDVPVPQGMRARVQVIDTWDMTIEELPDVHTGTVRVDLPAKPYMAVRLIAVEADA